MITRPRAFSTIRSTVVRADAPPVVYEVDGEQYIAIVTGGNSIQRSATGDAVWAFALKGKLGPSWWPPRPPSEMISVVD